MKNKKGNIAVVAIIIVIVAITAGVIGWLFAKKSSTPATTLESKNPAEKPLNLPQQPAQEYNSRSFLYKNNNDLVLYDPTTEKKQIVLSSDKLIDYDLSQDGKFAAYSLKEDGFQGNSDIYLKNIATGAIARLTEKNDIASLNPKIFPDNSKVAYVRRTFNQTTKKLSDGEIWVINADGNIDSSKRLFGDDSKSFIKSSDLEKSKDENGKWTGEYMCIGKDEIDAVKIGIYQIGMDGKEIAYWKSSWAPECSGLWQYPQYSNIDGSDFFITKFNQQNYFVDPYNNSKGKIDWQVSKVFWLDNGDFIVVNDAFPPFSGESAYYYDKDQNKKWVLYDSFGEDNGGKFSQIFISDMKKTSENKFLVAYQLYFNRYDEKYFSDGKFAGDKYFVKEVSFGEKISSDNLMSEKPFYISEDKENSQGISNVRIIGNNFVTYNKDNPDNSVGLYLYDLAKDKEVKLWQ